MNETFRTKNIDYLKNSGQLISWLIALFMMFGGSHIVFANEEFEDIMYYVQEALRQDPRVDASKIAVTTLNGIVTLKGQVDNLAVKQYSDLEAKKIDGVLGVINEIQVIPSTRSDLDIALDVRRRILHSTVIKAQGMNVECNNGNIAISGEVDSMAEKQEAGLLASEVRGVVSVRNNLNLNYNTNRPDHEIKEDIESVIKRDIYLTNLPVTATVQDGFVTLSGMVENAYEKHRAGNHALWVSHVKDIRNSIKVGLPNLENVKEQPYNPSDEDLKEIVWEELTQDTRVSTVHMAVEVFKGHVTLEGEALNYHQKYVAETDVRDVVGVGWVTNNLTIRVDHREDESIARDVEFNIHSDASLTDADINVSVNNAIIILSGKVDTNHDKYHAQDVVMKIMGVKGVINKIEVINGKEHSDEYLAELIKKRLKMDWATIKVASTIDVTVRDHVAILNGTVKQWAQRKEAEGIAVNTQGILTVNNYLMVEGIEYPWQKILNAKQPTDDHAAAHTFFFNYGDTFWF